MKFEMETCKNCGPKEAYLFAPHQLGRKTAYCMKCFAKRRKERIVPNPVPGDRNIIFGWKALNNER